MGFSDIRKSLIIRCLAGILSCMILLGCVYLVSNKYYEIKREKKKISLQEKRIAHLKNIYNRLLQEANLIGKWNRLWEEIEKVDLLPDRLETYSFNISSKLQWKDTAYLIILLNQYQKKGKNTFFVPGQFVISPSSSEKNATKGPSFNITLSGEFLKVIRE